ncbi:MAG: di-heme-cytochrome C peroxidase [Candidatus Acidiferrum sp.]
MTISQVRRAPRSRKGWKTMLRKITFVVFAIVLILAIVGLKWWRDNRETFTVDLPNYPPLGRVVWLPQNWTADQSEWFYHADQGTQTFGIPYEWFMALEQPVISLSSPGLLSDPVYLDRYGFIPDTQSAKPELPIGFAHNGIAQEPSGAPFRNPRTNKPMISLGLTCAACHTGRLSYEDKTIVIDGGPALTNIKNFQKAVGLSIVFTHLIPGRLSRFADRVLGPGASDEAKTALRKQFDAVYAQATNVAKLESAVNEHTIDEGYARLDALTRIGNTVFALDTADPATGKIAYPENFLGYSAPVHYPRIWDSSWFQWVQYNGSIQGVMTRNAGEALGVRAVVNLTGPQDKLYASSAQVATIDALEQSLAGGIPFDKKGNPRDQAGNEFSGLRSPKWPDKILPPVNTDLAARGAVLYRDRCQRCHLPPVSTPEFWTAPEWSAPDADGQRLLDLHMLPLAVIGTDPAQATDMQARCVQFLASLGITDDDGQVVTTATFGSALGKVVTNTTGYWFDHQSPPTPTPERLRMNGSRGVGVRALLAYKARPLNGIWATPPYLHNASVPNLYALLSPAGERPKTFYLGNREYDPVNVGYRTDKLASGFLFDTTIRGNSNAGHEFNDSSGPGTIGPLLSPDERRALIEFLKTQ